MSGFEKDFAAYRQAWKACESHTEFFEFCTQEFGINFAATNQLIAWVEILSDNILSSAVIIIDVTSDAYKKIEAGEAAITFPKHEKVAALLTKAGYDVTVRKYEHNYLDAPEITHLQFQLWVPSEQVKDPDLLGWLKRTCAKENRETEMAEMGFTTILSAPGRA